MNSRTLSPNGQSTSQTSFLNPIAKRIGKIDERDCTSVTYAGVAQKTAFFLFMALLGAAAALIVHGIPFDGITDDNGIFVSYIEICALLLSLVFMIVCPFLAVLLKKTAPVTGSLSCVGNGCFLGTLGVFFPEYRGAMLLAFLVTFALVGVMLFVYFSGKFNISKKFKTAAVVFAGTVLIGGLLFGVCRFIPACRDIYAYVQNNALLSILFSLGGIAIAIMFLFMDFDAVRSAVEKKLPQKYEWVCAYSLAFTVIWLYFKLLDIFLAAQNNRNS